MIWDAPIGAKASALKFILWTSHWALGKKELPFWEIGLQNGPLDTH
jgi:hypothetical protein